MQHEERQKMLYCLCSLLELAGNELEISLPAGVAEQGAGQHEKAVNSPEMSGWK